MLNRHTLLFHQMGQSKMLPGAGNSSLTCSRTNQHGCIIKTWGCLFSDFSFFFGTFYIVSFFPSKAHHISLVLIIACCTEAGLLLLVALFQVKNNHFYHISSDPSKSMFCPVLFYSIVSLNWQKKCGGTNLVLWKSKYSKLKVFEMDISKYLK